MTHYSAAPSSTNRAAASACASCAKPRDHLHADRQSAIGDMSGNVDAGHAHQRPEPVVAGIAGRCEPLRRRARRRKVSSTSTSLEYFGQARRSPRRAIRARVVIFRRRDARWSRRAWPRSSGAHRVVMLAIFPGERLMRLEILDDRVDAPGFRNDLAADRASARRRRRVSAALIATCSASSRCRLPARRRNPASRRRCAASACSPACSNSGRPVIADKPLREIVHAGARTARRCRASTKSI